MAVPTPVRRDRVSVPFALFAVSPALAPLIVVAAVIPLSQARAANPAGLPLAFAVVGAVLLVFAIGYLAMSRHIPNAGSLYAYVAHGLGRPAGLGTAWLSLVTYGLIQLSLYGLIGVASSEVATRLFGTDVSWWITALASWLVVALVGLFPAQAKGWIVVTVGGLGLAAAVTIALTLALGPSGAAHGSGPDLLAGTSLAASGALLLPPVFAFAGFESAARFANVGRLPGRAVGVLTYASVLVGAALFTFSAWAVVAHPSIVDTPAAFGLLEGQLPPAVIAVAAVVLLAAVLAALVSWQEMVVRLTRSLRLERVPSGTLPLPWSPLRSVALVSAPGLAVLVLVAALRLDPVSWLLMGAGMVGAYGLLLALLLTSTAVTVFFARDHRQESVLRRLLAPAAAALLLACAAVLAAAHLEALLGVGPAIARLVAVAVPLVAGAGSLAATVARIRRPHRYRAIGLGPNAITGHAQADHITPPPYVATHSALTSH